MNAALSLRNFGHSSLRHGAGQVSSRATAKTVAMIAPPTFGHRQLRWNSVCWRSIKIGYSNRRSAMQWSRSAFVLAVVFFSNHASADPARKSEDIVKFFAGAADLGKSRGICVGSEEECNKSNTNGQQEGRSNLDMLINFGLDSAQLDATARAELEEFAKALKDNRLSTFNFVVEGYTDATGTLRYNEGLSQRRAKSVAAFLTASGVEAARINAVGMGEKNPRNANPYDPANRRVEMRIKTQ
ncbi:MULTISPECIES: OmpA family protein [unclassified Mesorhizobium]|uniref:OmpA family protein n=1 Tax=unclassified Mesorhizobium TaxID=325217 RepID=UPI002961F4C1|nr:OmpA family protein [Mesorhizobium sp. BR1-1-14]